MIVSFYTPGYYEEVAHARLLPSVRALGIEHDVRLVQLPEPTTGDRMRNWTRNCAFRADFLGQLRAEHAGKDLLWVDCDAVVHRDPLEDLRDGYSDVDLAAHYLHGRELLAGTLWLPAASRRTGELLERWRTLTGRHAQAGDLSQRWLAQAVDELRSEVGLTVAQLPPQYCFIFDTMRRIHPGLDPIIEHFQASRQLRRGRRA